MMEEVEDREGNSGCWGRARPRTGNRVVPALELTNLIEIRPKRVLNVLCLGPGTRSVYFSADTSRKEVNQYNGILEDVGIFPDGQSAIFFIHGVGGSSNVWRAQYNYFSSIGYNVIVPDLIGHGLSQGPKMAAAYHFNEIALDLLAIFDRFHKPKNVLIGHSYGASFAAYMSKERAEFVTKVILISGGGPTPLGPQTGVFQLPVCMLGCIKSCVRRRLLEKAFYKNHDVAINRNDAFCIPTYVLRHMMRGQDWLNGNVDFHANLIAPILLIHAANDKLISLKEVMFMSDVLNGAVLEIVDGASHMVMMEKPEAVNRLIQRFLTVKQWQFSRKLKPGVSYVDAASNVTVRRRPNPLGFI